MDPNSGKKGMFNKLSKDQAVDLLKDEDFKRKTVSFYRYVILENPNKLRDELYADWLELGVLGRIYLAIEGMHNRRVGHRDLWVQAADREYNLLVMDGDADARRPRADVRGEPGIIVPDDMWMQRPWYTTSPPGAWVQRDEQGPGDSQDLVRVMYSNPEDWGWNARDFEQNREAGLI